MKCKQVQPHLKDYLDHRLDSQVQTEISGHLESCPDCRRELSFLKSYLQSLKDFSPQNAPAHLISLVEAEVNQKAARPLIRHWLYPASGIVLAGMMIWLAVMNFSTFRLAVSNNQKDILKYTASNPIATPETAVSGINESQPEKSEKRLPPIGKTQKEEQTIAATKNHDLVIVLWVAPKPDSAIETVEASKGLILEKSKPAKFSTRIQADQVQDSRTDENGGVGETGADMAATIRQILKTNQGKIVKEELDNVNQQVTQIAMAVPAEKYRQFLEDLKKISEVKREEPKNQQNTGMQQILIKIEY
jgi:hypothetical protein